MSLILFILIGAIAGWLAGQIIKGSSFGLLINILVGIAGSIIGGWLSESLGLGSNGLWGTLPTATIGAIILLFVVGKFKK